MRAIIVNANDRTITETDIVGSLRSLQQIVGGLIEPVSQGLDDYHHCYVNEEGLLNDPQDFFMFSGGPPPLAGKGVLLLSDHHRGERPHRLPLPWGEEGVALFDLRPPSP